MPADGTRSRLVWPAAGAAVLVAIALLGLHNQIAFWPAAIALALGGTAAAFADARTWLVVARRRLLLIVGWQLSFLAGGAVIALTLADLRHLGVAAGGFVAGASGALIAHATRGEHIGTVAARTIGLGVGMAVGANVAYVGWYLLAAGFDVVPATAAVAGALAGWVVRLFIDVQRMVERALRGRASAGAGVE